MRFEVASSIRTLALVAGIIALIAGPRAAGSIACHAADDGTPGFRDRAHDVPPYVLDPASTVEREFPEAGLDESSDPDESDDFDRSHPGCSTFPPMHVGLGTPSEVVRPRDSRCGANHVRGPPEAR